MTDELNERIWSDPEIWKDIDGESAEIESGIARSAHDRRTGISEETDDSLDKTQIIPIVSKEQTSRRQSSEDDLRRRREIRERLRRLRLRKEAGQRSVKKGHAIQDAEEAEELLRRVREGGQYERFEELSQGDELGVVVNEMVLQSLPKHEEQQQLEPEAVPAAEPSPDVEHEQVPEPVETVMSPSNESAAPSELDSAQVAYPMVETDSQSAESASAEASVVMPEPEEDDEEDGFAHIGENLPEEEPYESEDEAYTAGPMPQYEDSEEEAGQNGGGEDPTVTGEGTKRSGPAHVDPQKTKELQEQRRKRLVGGLLVCLVVVITALIALFLRPVDRGQEEEEYHSTVASLSDGTLPVEGLETTQVYRGNFVTEVYAENGTTTAADTTKVVPEVDGVVQNLRVVAGSQVSEGDVLFTVKSTEVERALTEAQDAVNEAQSALDQATVDLNNANLNYENQWRVCYEKNDFSDFDEAGLNAVATEADNRRVRAINDLSVARNALSDAQARSDRLTVRSPRNGLVVSLNIVNGSNVEANPSPTEDAYLEISDMASMRVTVQVSEADISGIAVGMPATVTFTALPGVESAGVVEATSNFPTEGSEEGQVNYAVSVLVSNPNPGLKAGMTAAVAIMTHNEADVLIIPSSSILEQVGVDGQVRHYVQLLTYEGSSEARMAEVAIIDENGSEAAVWGDLNEGDYVIVNPIGASSDVSAMSS